MKITIFVNFAESLLKTPLAITLEDTDTLAKLHKIRIDEYKTPYDSVYNSPIAMPLEYQHKDRIFNSSDLNTSLCNLGLRDNDRLNINISNITIDIMHAALTADLLATNVNDLQPLSTPFSLALLAQRQLSNQPWTTRDIQSLKENIEFVYAIRLPKPMAPHAYNQLTPLFTALHQLDEKLNETENRVITFWNPNEEIYLPNKSLIFLVPKTLQNTIEEKNNVLLKFSPTKNNQLLLFRNELRFLLKEKGFENSEVEVYDTIIRITNINLAKLVKIEAIPILPDAVTQALLTDLAETKPEEALSNQIPSSLKLIAKRQQSQIPWEKKEILTLQNHLAEISGNRPGDYPQLLPQYAMLNLLRSQLLMENQPVNKIPKQMLELNATLMDSKFDLGKIKRILSQDTYASLRLYEGSLEINNLVQLAEAVQSNTTLEALKVEFYHSITETERNTTFNSHIGILIAGLKNNKTLLTLNIYINKFSQENMQALADLLRKSTTLRSVTFNYLVIFSDVNLDNCLALLIAAAKDSTSLENFTCDRKKIFTNKPSVQWQHRRRYTSDCMLSLLNNDSKYCTDVTERSGHLDFEFAALISIANMIIELNLLPKDLAHLMTKYLEKNDIIFLPPLPMNKEILAKTPPLADLTKEIVLDIKENKSNNDNVVITFNEGTPIHQKLLFRNALMKLFRENQMNEAAADVSISTGLLTINNMTLQQLEELNILPQSYNNRTTLVKSFVA